MVTIGPSHWSKCHLWSLLLADQVSLLPYVFNTSSDWSPESNSKFSLAPTWLQLTPCSPDSWQSFCLGADCLTRSPDFNSTHGFLSDSTWNRGNNFSFMSVVKIYFVKIYGGRWNFVCCINVFMNDTVVNFYLSPKQASCFLFVWNISRERSFASNTLVSSLPLIISFQE